MPLIDGTGSPGRVVLGGQLYKIKILSNREKWQSPGEKGLSYLRNNCLSSFVCACNQYGLSSVIDTLLKDFYKLQNSSDPFSLRRFRSIYSKLINWDLHSSDINFDYMFRLNHNIYIRESDRAYSLLDLENDLYDFSNTVHLYPDDPRYKLIREFILYITDKSN